MTRYLRKTLLALSFSIAAVSSVALLGEPIDSIDENLPTYTEHAPLDSREDQAAVRRMQMTLPYVGRILHREER
ncbi:MAG: hypothetical protein R3F04_10035 [Lysobacteraceae bacterium]